MSFSQQLKEAMGKKATLASAKAAVKKHAGDYPADKIQIDSDTIALWYDDEENHFELKRKAEKIAKAIAKDLDAPSVTSGGNKHIIWYKRKPDLDLDNNR